MKKLYVGVIAVAVTLMLVGSAFAAKGGRAHQNTGCGLGTMLWQNNSDNSILSQSLQATTNGTSGNQTFGITTGTSECDQPSKFASNERVNEFVVANMDNLAKDIAMGQGETLDAFAELLQVPAGQRAEFSRKLQASFAKIFTSEHVVLANVMDNVAAATSH